jgi:repressor LexA
MADQKQLTGVQSKILEAIVSYRREKGYNPTMREVGEAVGLSSTSSVSYQLSQLRELGFLSKADAAVACCCAASASVDMSSQLKV